LCAELRAATRCGVDELLTRQGILGVDATYALVDELGELCVSGQLLLGTFQFGDVRVSGDPATEP